MLTAAGRQAGQGEREQQKVERVDDCGTAARSPADDYELVSQFSNNHLPRTTLKTNHD